MASQITIIDPSLRRVVVKVAPSKYLSEVLDEACSKLRLNPEQYMLKRNDKQVDLSVTYRLSGLPSGCKLELIQRSKSPSVVSVALQIPAGLAADGLASRLISKFPSDRSLWQILRTFESGNVDGSGRSWNFTGRSVKTSSSENEVYAFPRIQAMGRDFSTIEELQKTLSQLGISDGSVLMKLDLIATSKSFDQAKDDMKQYFMETPPEDKASTGPSETPAQQLSNITNESSTPQNVTPTTATLEPSQEPTERTPSIIDSRPTTVFRPPTASTPQAALFSTTDSDFEPSVDLLKQHQAVIQQSTRNKRLPTDAELEAEAAASATKLASIKKIDIKIVFPDQSSVLAPFTSDDTSKELYSYVRGLLARSQEGFTLSFSGTRGLVAIDENNGKRLIKDLKLTGRVLVRVLWADNVGLEARQTPSLRADVVKIAQDVQINSFTETDAQSAPAGTPSESKKEDKKSSGGKMPKWLKLPGKK